MLPENIKKQEKKKPIMLGAHYYPWYRRKPDYPTLGGGDWEAGYTNHPVIGKYNNQDSRVITQHLIWVKEAGIDFLVLEWVGLEACTDAILRDYYLLAFKKLDVEFCVHYDSTIALNRYRSDWAGPAYDFNERYSANKTKGQKFLEDFEYLADNYFSHPQYLKISGKPVVIIYNVSAFRNSSEYLEKLKINMAKKGITLFLVADVVCWAGIKLSKENLSFFWKTPLEQIVKVFYRAVRRLFLNNLEEDISLSKHFNGITGYNMYAVNRITPKFLENVDNVYRKFWDYARSHNLYFIPTVMPGYDDRNLKGFERPILERKNGEFYKEFWKIAKKYLDPVLKMILITTFNEWHEGSEIEPSKEHGQKYLRLTKLLKG